MSGDDFSDQSEYAQFEAQMAKDSSDELGSELGLNLEKTPLDQRQVEEGARQLSRDHADILQEAETENARQQRHAEVIRQTHGQEQQQRTYEEFQRAQQQLKQDDPMAYFEGLISNLYHQSAQMAQSAQEREFWGSIDSSERKAREEITDYNDAISHLEHGRYEEIKRALPDAVLRQRGYANPDAVRLQMLNHDRIRCAQEAIQLGRDPATYYYEIALSRGYRSARGLTRTESNQLASLYDRSLVDESAGEAFDKAWDQAARLNRL